MLEQFKPRRPPLKEGRSHPGLPYSDVMRRRGISTAQVAVLLAIIVLGPLFYVFVYDSGDVSTNVGVQSMLTKAKPLIPEAKAAVEEAVAAVLPTTSIAADVPPSQAQEFEAPPAPAPVSGNGASARAPAEQAPVVEEVQDVPVTAAPKGYSGSSSSSKSSSEGPTDSSSLSSNNKSPSTKTSLTFSERPKFEAALAHVITLLPGEMNMRDLLRAVEGTGKEKLREMGLRTRAYQIFFQAWEDLHLTTDAEGGQYVRDDVVQYIRNHEHKLASDGIAGGDALAGLGIGEIIRKYESYRFFLSKFGQLLFPWTAPYFSDHMTLHAHMKRGGRGIVLTAGDDQAPYLLTTIYSFRT